jgi:hypothetical protein
MCVVNLQFIVSTERIRIACSNCDAGFCLIILKKKSRIEICGILKNQIRIIWQLSLVNLGDSNFEPRVNDTKIIGLARSLSQNFRIYFLLFGLLPYSVLNKLVEKSSYKIMFGSWSHMYKPFPGII